MQGHLHLRVVLVDGIALLALSCGECQASLKFGEAVRLVEPLSLLGHPQIGQQERHRVRRRNWREPTGTRKGRARQSELPSLFDARMSRPSVEGKEASPVEDRRDLDNVLSETVDDPVVTMDDLSD